MKIGELARRTGVSIRTLHYYDEIGLLSPSLHSAAGHRVYGLREITRLQQIRSLQQIGFSLKEIRSMLSSRAHSPLSVVEMHLARAKEQIATQQKLCDRLESLAKSMRSRKVSVDQLISTIEVMNMFEKYYSREQLDELQQRAELLGEDGMRKAQQDWVTLMAEVRAEMEKGTDPESPQVRALARRWRVLIEAFTGGNSEIEKSLRTMYQSEPVHQKIQGTPEPGMMAYIGKAMRA
jgi:MerR family transcriptional regulator, thiopeptide resistance regulator